MNPGAIHDDNSYTPYAHCLNKEKFPKFQEMLNNTEDLLDNIRSYSKDPSLFPNETQEQTIAKYLSRYNNCVKEFNDVYKEFVLNFEVGNKEKMEPPKQDGVQAVLNKVGITSLTPNLNKAKSDAANIQTELQKRKDCFFKDVDGSVNSPAANLNLVFKILKGESRNFNLPDISPKKIVEDMIISDIPFLKMIDTSENDEVPKGGRKRKTRQQTNRRRHRRQRKSRRHHRK